MKILSLSIALLSLFFISCSSTTELSTEDLRAPFAKNKDQVDSCYTKVMKKQPDLGEGTVEMKFLINTEGKAYKTIFMKKRSTLSNKLLNACIKRVVHGWQFPAGKGVDLVYPFNFESQSGSFGSDTASAKPVEPAAAKKAAPADPKSDSVDLDVIDNSPQSDDLDAPSNDEETPLE